MLNKPTNVSPYNVFVDASNGLDLNFTLNNTVDAFSVDIYKDNNSIVGSELINNSSLEREFSYNVPENILSNITNGDNCYWKTRYWKNPLEDNKKSEFEISYWDKDRHIIGVLPNPIEGLEISGVFNNMTEGSNVYNNIFFMNTNISRNTKEYDLWKDIISDCKTNEYYLGFENIGGYRCVFFEITYITDDPSGKSYDFGVTISQKYEGSSTESYNEAKYMQSLIGEAERMGVIPKLYKMTNNENSIKQGEYISLSLDGNSYLYRVYSTMLKSELLDEYLSTPYIELSLHSVLPTALHEISDYISSNTTMYVTGYSKAEYNESPPYYFSCRETPDIDIYDISTNTPQIRMRANLKKYVDINSYRYQVYRLKDSNTWDLLWQSEKMSTINRLNDGTFNTEVAIYNGLQPQSTYKVKIMGQTTEGMDFEAEHIFLSQDFLPTKSRDFVSFNKELGCVEIDNSAFFSPLTTCELQIYRYDVLKDELNYVATSKYDFNVTNETGGYCKRTKTYDFNVVSDAQYIYYAYILDDDVIMDSYISNDITPSWSGVYINDVIYENSTTYAPDKSKVWFISLNHETSEINRNYQVSHPHGVGQKYPKSIRGEANFKTGQFTGLLGGISCKNGDYEEGVFLLDSFDSFCANGKPKHLRSSVRGEHMIVDIDRMNSSEFVPTVTSVSVGYTQIDDTIRKQISIEV